MAYAMRPTLAATPLGPQLRVDNMSCNVVSL
jgi:hypothetical protein